MVKICVKFLVDIRFILALGRALRKIVIMLHHPCAHRLTHISGSYPLLVTSGEAWYIPYISPGATRSVNHERLPRVHASTVPTDQRQAAPPPMPRCVPGILTRADKPTTAVWTGGYTASAASAGDGAHWPGACAGLSRGASTKRRLRRSRCARPNICRFTIFRRLIWPSTGTDR